jgi:hypothetical protein
MHLVLLLTIVSLLAQYAAWPSVSELCWFAALAHFTLSFRRSILAYPNEWPNVVRAERRLAVLDAQLAAAPTRDTRGRFEPSEPIFGVFVERAATSPAAH